MLTNRLVDLDKEIEQHLINWRKDEYFKTLPKDLQKKIKEFIDYFSFIRNSDGTLPLFESDDKEDPKKKNFKKPTLEEVKVYCEERKNNVDAELFIDFYESKGWKVGKDSMKDWKACVRTWEKSQKKKILSWQELKMKQQEEAGKRFLEGK